MGIFSESYYAVNIIDMYSLKDMEDYFNGKVTKDEDENYAKSMVNIGLVTETFD